MTYRFVIATSKDKMKVNSPKWEYSQYGFTKRTPMDLDDIFAEQGESTLGHGLWREKQRGFLQRDGNLKDFLKNEFLKQTLLTRLQEDEGPPDHTV